jgi:hypothetical protein
MKKTSDTSSSESVENFAFSPGGSMSLVAGDETITIESAEDKIAIMGGSLSISRDAQGLALAQALATVFADAVKVMQADKAAGNLPETLTLLKPTVRANPFA